MWRGPAQRKLSLRADSAHYAAGQFAAMLEVSGSVMGKKGYRLTGRVRASRAIALLRLFACQREAVAFLAALILLVNAAVPYWHAAQMAEAGAAALAKQHAAHHAAMSAPAGCPLEHAGTAGQTGGDEAPLSKKPCPLCQALQLFSPGVAQPGFAFVPCAPHTVAALVPHQAELVVARYAGVQARPRAPPLA